MSAPPLDDVLIACTLDPGDYKARMAWIAGLNAHSLRASRRNDLTLELTYLTTALPQVRQLVAQEETCCAFLAFDLRDEVDGLRLTIAAPEAAREAAELIFAAFEAKSVAAADAAVCGCCGGAAE